jgi:hypothetical protein
VIEPIVDAWRAAFWARRPTVRTDTDATPVSGEVLMHLRRRWSGMDSVTQEDVRERCAALLLPIVDSLVERPSRARPVML